MKTNIFSLKKITAVVIAFLMMILSVSYSNTTNSDAANMAIKYRIFNAKTGVQIGDDYTLGMHPDEKPLIPCSIVGDDDRIVNWDRSGVVKIMDSYGGFSSGFVVSDHVIATAAHCVYDYEFNVAIPLSEVLLFDNKGNVTLHATPVQYHVPLPFIITSQNSQDYRIKADYALITVKEDLSSYACFDLGVPLEPFDSSNSVVTVAGFPRIIGNPNEEKIVNTTTKHMMYSGSGKVYNPESDKVKSNSLIFYKADSTTGDSGGPVYITESAYGETYYTVVGINAASPKKSNEYNAGVRIDSNLIYFFTGNNENIKWE